MARVRPAWLTKKFCKAQHILYKNGMKKQIAQLEVWQKILRLFIKGGKDV